MHRVRVLRAQVPQPGADPHPPAAHRGAPGGRPAWASPARTRPSRPPCRTPTSTWPWTPAPPTACAPPPARCPSTPARSSSACAAPATRPGPTPSALKVARHFGPVEPLVRLGLRSGHLVQSLFGPGPWSPSPACCGPSPAPATHQWSTEMPRPAKARLPGHQPRRRPGHLLPRLHLPPDGRPARRTGRPEPAGGAGGPGRRAGVGPAHPRRPPGGLLRRAVLLQGLRRGPRPHGEPGGGAVLALEPAKAACRWSWTPPPAPTA